MPSQSVARYLNTETYFITLTIKDWMYILDRHDRWDILSSAFKFYQNNRNLKLYSFVFMLNHIHFIAQCDDMIAFIRDFKKFTTGIFKDNLKITEPSLVKRFLNDNRNFTLWEKTNMPIPLYTQKYFIEKHTYILNNPVKRGYVVMPEHWYWSSANEKCELKVAEIVE